MSRVGISTSCFYPETVYDSLKRVVKLGAPVTEIFMNSFSEMSHEKLSELKSLAESGGTQIISFHPFFSASDHLFLFSDYEYRLKDGIDIYRRFFEAAAFLSARILVFHGERMHGGIGGISQLTADKLCDIYGRLLEAASEFGVTLAQESVTAYRSESPMLIRFLRRSFDDIRFTLDIKQILRAGHSVDEMLDVMSGRIVQVHLNNFRSGVCTLPFDGAADLKKIKDTLHGSGYKGDYCIEVYSSNFKSDEELSDAMMRSQSFFGRR